MWLLTVLFGFRVAGQAMQRWRPQSWLPDFTSWQGSSLTYPPLLATQLAILPAMIAACVRASRGRAVLPQPARRAVRAFGWLYLGASLARLGIGLAWPGADPWFTAWIPVAFHIDLALFVLLLSGVGARALSYAWYPVLLLLAITAFATLLARGVPPAVAAYVPAVAVGVAIFLLERRFPERRDWRPGRGDLAADAAFMLLVMVALPRLLALLAVTTLAQWRHDAAAVELWPHAWPVALQVVLMIVTVDFARYWLHRASHAWGPLWRLHKVHHSPDLLYVVNVGRFHPLEKALHFGVDTLPFLALGVGPEVLAGYFLVYSVNGFFQHSNLRLRYGWLNYVVGSAETHRWHHARDARLAACNFGSTTVVWDLLFGTWKLPGAVGEVGIADRAYPKGFLAQLAAPFDVAGHLIAARLRLACLLARWRMERTLRDPMRAQEAVLARIVRRNRGSEFGRRHGFDEVRGYDDYARRVPVVEFEGLRPWIERDIAEPVASLTADMPERYVRTSGSTGKPKDVPLVASHIEALRRINQEGVAFQYRACPAAFAGSIFVLVSPADEGRLANGRAFGAASGVVAANTPALVRSRFVVPPAVLTVGESHVKYLLALRLALARRDVTYLGSANPATILALAKLYREHHAALIGDVGDGTFFLEHRVDPAVMHSLRDRLRADPERARELAALHERGPVRLADLWPTLKLVVTWTGGSAGLAIDAMRREIPVAARVMELGYLSSEFRATVTLGRRAGSGLPTLDTHFFEFAECAAWDAGAREVLTLSQLRKGRDYYVIVTTPSGLYRYFMNDIVRVTGFLRATPLLRFVQKGKGVTSITGEKLYEAQVLQALRDAMEARGGAAHFAMMLADEEASAYTLYVEPCDAARSQTADLAAAIDARLGELNVEYRAKRESSRLAPLAVRWLGAGAGEAYKRHCVAAGQREGQFKIVALDYRRHFSYDLDAHVAA
jgi:sterol desaturase/sphingolipid hydroxylase (fatty acid hydroxylase superfamily)